MDLRQFIAFIRSNEERNSITPLNVLSPNVLLRLLDKYHDEFPTTKSARYAIAAAIVDGVARNVVDIAIVEEIMNRRKISDYWCKYWVIFDKMIEHKTFDIESIIGHICGVMSDENISLENFDQDISQYACVMFIIRHLSLFTKARWPCLCTAKRIFKLVIRIIDNEIDIPENYQYMSCVVKWFDKNDFHLNAFKLVNATCTYQHMVSLISRSVMVETESIDEKDIACGNMVINALMTIFNGHRGAVQQYTDPSIFHNDVTTYKGKKWFAVYWKVRSSRKIVNGIIYDMDFVAIFKTKCDCDRSKGELCEFVNYGIDTLFADKGCPNLMLCRNHQYAIFSNDNMTSAYAYAYANGMMPLVLDPTVSEETMHYEMCTKLQYCKQAFEEPLLVYTAVSQARCYQLMVAYSLFYRKTQLQYNKVKSARN